MDNEIVTHLFEIKERLASIETKVEAHNNFDGRVQVLERGVAELKTSQKTYKWGLGVIVALGVGLMKALK